MSLFHISQGIFKLFMTKPFWHTAHGRTIGLCPSNSSLVGPEEVNQGICGTL